MTENLMTRLSSRLRENEGLSIVMNVMLLGAEG